MKEGDRYSWLDPFRGGLDEVICWVVSPECTCEWRLEPRHGELIPGKVLDVRNRSCPLHGEDGLF